MARPIRSPERSGPHDADDVDPDPGDAPGMVDFGAVRVPVPERGTITVEPGENGRMQAVHISLPEGRLSVSALAAPKSSRLWPDLAKEGLLVSVVAVEVCDERYTSQLTGLEHVHGGWPILG